jgi:hypothetical protein
LATVSAPSFHSAEQRERTFFLLMAFAIAITVVTAFWFFRTAGFASFSAPWWVHVHAVTFMTWIGFYLVQNALIWRGDGKLHRKLGYFGAFWAGWMVVVGVVLTPLTLAVGRSPPFFTPAYFLALDWVNIVVFAGLFIAGFRNRRRTEWHRRLMLCATVCLIAPAIGRLMILGGMEMTAPMNVALLLPYVIAGILADLVIRRRVHPAYAWGTGALIAFAAGTELLARFPPLIALGERLAA